MPGWLVGYIRYDEGGRDRRVGAEATEKPPPFNKFNILTGRKISPSASKRNLASEYTVPSRLAGELEETPHRVGNFRRAGQPAGLVKLTTQPARAGAGERQCERGETEVRRNRSGNREASLARARETRGLPNAMTLSRAAAPSAQQEAKHEEIIGG